MFGVKKSRPDTFNDEFFLSQHKNIQFSNIINNISSLFLRYVVRSFIYIECCVLKPSHNFIDFSIFYASFHAHIRTYTGLLLMGHRFEL